DNFEAGEFRVIARADALQLAPRAGVSEVHRSRHAIRYALKPRAVGEERIAVIVPGVPPRIASAFGEYFEPIAGRVEPPDAGTVQPHYAVRRLNMRVGINGLVHVDVPIVTPAQRVQVVVRVLGAETGKNDKLLVRLAIAIRVFEIK